MSRNEKFNVFNRSAINEMFLERRFRFVCSFVFISGCNWVVRYCVMSGLGRVNSKSNILRK